MGSLLLLLFLVFCIVFLIVFTQLVSLRTSVKALQSELTALTKIVKGLDGSRARSTSVDTNAAPGAHPSTEFPPTVPAAGSAAQPLKSASGAPGIPTFPPALPPTPSRTREEWEALIGGKLLNRVGALALIIGVGFFLKYAFDNNWISETVRVLIGGSLGGVLLFVAAKAHARDFEVFAQGLVGAGIAILYISVYASFNFYHLVPQSIAFLLMGAVTVVAFTQSFRYESLVVSLLGMAGGYLTPFLLSTGQSNTVGLFSYVFLLAAGLLFVVYRRPRWFILQPLTVLLTSGVYLAWYLDQYNESDFGLGVFFLFLLWFLFLLFNLASESRGGRLHDTSAHVVIGLTAVAAHWILMELLSPSHANFKGSSTFLLALIFFVCAAFIWRRKPVSSQGWSILGLLSAYFIVMGIGIQWTGEWIIVGWAIATIAVLWIAIRSGASFLPGIILLLPIMNTVYLIGQSLLGEPSVGDGYRPLFNERTLAYSLTIVSIALAAQMLRKGKQRWAEKVALVLDYVWPTLLLVLLTVETNDLFRYREWAGGEHIAVAFQRWLAFALLWTAAGAAFVWAGKVLRVNPLQSIGTWSVLLGMVVALTRGLAYEPLSIFSPVVNERAFVLILVSALGYIVSRLRKSLTLGERQDRILVVLRIGTALLFLSLSTGEVRDAFEKAMASNAGPLQSSLDATRLLQNLEQLSLSGLWIVYSIAIMVFGLVRRIRSLRIFAIVIFGITILKVFFYDLSFLETLYRIVSFMGLGLILLATSYLYQRNKDVILDRTQ